MGVFDSSTKSTTTTQLQPPGTFLGPAAPFYYGGQTPDSPFGQAMSQFFNLAAGGFEFSPDAINRSIEQRMGQGMAQRETSLADIKRSGMGGPFALAIDQSIAARTAGDTANIRAEGKMQQEMASLSAMLQANPALMSFFQNAQQMRGMFPQSVTTTGSGRGSIFDQLVGGAGAAGAVLAGMGSNSQQPQPGGQPAVANQQSAGFAPGGGQFGQFQMAPGQFEFFQNAA